MNPRFLPIVGLLVAMLAAAPAALADNTKRDLVLVLDNSGSMRKVDPKYLLKDAVTQFLADLNGDTRAAILIFDQTSRLVVPLTEISDDTRQSLIDGLKGIDYRGRWTNSPDAIEKAVYELKLNGRPDAEHSVVFFTDGIVDTGNKALDVEKTEWLREDLAAEAAANNVRIYSIAFTDQADLLLIQSLARRTGGEYFRALEAGGLQEAFTRIGEQLKQPRVVAAPAVPPPPPMEPPTARVPEATQPPAVAEPAPHEVPGVTPEPSTEAATPTTPAETAPAETTASSEEDEQKAREEFEKASGLSMKDLENLPQGQAIIVRPGAPPEEHTGVATWIIALGGLLILALGALAFMLLKQRRTGGAKSVAAGSLTPDKEYVPEAYLNDLGRNTNEPSYLLTAKPVMFGRVAGTDREHLDYVVVNQSTVGRRHALIEYKDFAFWIVDQASVNGTYVNGERVTGERRLKHGDRIRLHKYEFEFVMPELADSSKTVFSGGADKTVIAGPATMIGRPDTAAFPAAAAGAAIAAPAVAEHLDDGTDADEMELDLFADGTSPSPPHLHTPTPEPQPQIPDFDLAVEPQSAPEAELEALRETEMTAAQIDATATALFGRSGITQTSALPDTGPQEISAVLGPEIDDSEQATMMRPDLPPVGITEFEEEPERVTLDAFGEFEPRPAAGESQVDDDRTIVHFPGVIPAPNPAPEALVPEAPLITDVSPADQPDLLSLDEFISTSLFHATRTQPLQIADSAAPEGEAPPNVAEQEAASESAFADPGVLTPGSFGGLGKDDDDDDDRTVLLTQTRIPDAPSGADHKSAASSTSSLRPAPGPASAPPPAPLIDEGERTLMPSDVPEPAKKPAPPEDDDKTVFFAEEDNTRPPKRR